MTISQVCHVISEKKLVIDEDVEVVAAESVTSSLVEENDGISSGLISDNVFTRLLVAVLIIIKKYIKFYYYKFNYDCFIICPIFQDISICWPKTLKIKENANPELEKFIIIFIIVYPPI